MCASMGRPSKPDDESTRRGKLVRFRVPLSLYHRLAAAAAAAKLSIPKWVMAQCEDGLAEEKHATSIARGE